MAGLTTSFLQCFRKNFADQLASDPVGTRGLWPNKKGVWTELMLARERGLLVNAAKQCLTPATDDLQTVKHEWHKFDLMLVAEGGPEWWMSIPLITVEHEENDDIEHEVWKLACWLSQLKVLITYHIDETTRDAKLDLARSIIRRIASRHGDDRGEWLFVSAERTWPRDGDLEWQAWTWRGDWAPLI